MTWRIRRHGSAVFGSRVPGQDSPPGSHSASEAARMGARSEREARQIGQSLRKLRDRIVPLDFVGPGLLPRRRASARRFQDIRDAGING
jgi:hypothetical protein